MRLRVALTVAVALLGGLSLSACNNNPDVAAYVNGKTVTEAQVDGLVNNSPHVAPPSPAPTQVDGDQSATPTPAAEAPPITRLDAVTALVLGQLCADAQDRAHFKSGAVTAQQVADFRQVAATSPYAIQEAKTQSCLNGILASTAPVKPTDAQIQEIYDRANAAGLVQAPYSELKQQIADDNSVQQGTGQQAAIERLVEGENVTINPRYRPLQYVVSAFTNNGQSVPLIVATVGDPGSDAVHGAA